MNRITFTNLFFLFIITISFSQTKEDLELREMFWDTKGTNKNRDQGTPCLILLISAS